MNRSDAPSKKSVPFGINGPREAILDTTPAGNNQASYDSGFPPITMILKSAGGLPPKGEDFNQILYELALNARWNQAGGGYQFDSTFSTGISGYPIGAVVQNSTGDGTWINTTDGNTNNPEVSTVAPLTGWIPLDSNGFTSKTGLSNANITLTTLEASRERIILSGTLTANINLIVPAWRKKWTVVNNCSGAFSVTIKTTSGTGISIPSGMTAYVQGDGTNIIQDSNLLGISGRLLNIQVFTSSGTYTPTSGTKKIRVRLVGGGGGGGSAAGNTNANWVSLGTGGSAGTYGESTIIDATSITTVSVTVGNGGGGGFAGSAGNAGGSSSFGAYIVAPGGAAGGAGGSNSVTTPVFIADGPPTGNCTGTSVLVNIPGGGYLGQVTSSGTTGQGMKGSAGGSSFIGIGGGASQVNTVARSGSGYGSGGAGGVAAQVVSTNVAPGGSGATGIVIVEEYA